MDRRKLSHNSISYISFFSCLPVLRLERIYPLSGRFLYIIWWNECINENNVIFDFIGKVDQSVNNMAPWLRVPRPKRFMDVLTSFLPTHKCRSRKRYLSSLRYCWVTSINDSHSAHLPGQCDAYQRSQPVLANINRLSLLSWDLSVW